MSNPAPNQRDTFAQQNTSTNNRGVYHFGMEIWLIVYEPCRSLRLIWPLKAKFIRHWQVHLPLTLKTHTAISCLLGRVLFYLC